MTPTTISPTKASMVQRTMSSKGSQRSGMKGMASLMVLALLCGAFMWRGYGNEWKKQACNFPKHIWEIPSSSENKTKSHPKHDNSSSSPALPLFDDPECVSNKAKHPLTLTAAEQIFEYGFEVTNVRMVNKTKFIPKVRGLIDRSEEGLKIANQTDTDKCMKSLVPRKLHWIWVGGKKLPEKYVSSIFQFALRNPGWKIFLWGELYPHDLADKLQSIYTKLHFRNVTKMLEDDAFVNNDLILREQNVAGKSDYLRLELLYLEGGLYQDTDAHVIQSFDSVGNLFRWPFAAWQGNAYKNLCNCVLAFEKQSPFVRFAIRLTRENCLRFKKCGVMSGAGPDFISTAVAMYNSPEILLIHEDYILSKRNNGKRVTFHGMDHTWLAAYMGKNETPTYEGVRCGSHNAKFCSECPQGHGEMWCNGDCRWNKNENLCEPVPQVSFEIA